MMYFCFDVRLVLDLQSNMQVLGRRHPFMLRYKAGVDESGVVLFVNMDIYSDSGFSFFDDTSSLAELHARVMIVKEICTKHYLQNFDTYL